MLPNSLIMQEGVMFLRVDVTDGGVMAVGRVRQPIDFLEGDAVVMACRDLAR